MAHKSPERCFDANDKEFYSHVRLQKDSVFIEKVMHCRDNPYQAEDDMIDRIDAQRNGTPEWRAGLRDIRDASNHALMRASLAHLTPRELTIITMRAHGATFQKIADHLGHTVSWAHTLHKRALAKLADAAQKELKK